MQKMKTNHIESTLHPASAQCLRGSKITLLAAIAAFALLGSAHAGTCNTDPSVVTARLVYHSDLSSALSAYNLALAKANNEPTVDNAKATQATPRMFATPVVGKAYRQELLFTEAEDAAEIVALNESVTVPAGIDAPGIGDVLAVDSRTGKRGELSSVVKQ